MGSQGFYRQGTAFGKARDCEKSGMFRDHEHLGISRCSEGRWK